MLPRYNSLIERLAPDSVKARRELHEQAPYLFRNVLVLEANTPIFSIKGDTLEAKVPFQRHYASTALIAPYQNVRTGSVEAWTQNASLLLSPPATGQFDSDVLG